MNIAEEIYQQVQQLPEDMAREVLEFVDYLKKRQGLHPGLSPDLEKARHVPMHTLRENLGDEVWSDLLFGQSRFDAVTVNKAGRSQAVEAEIGEQ